MHVSALVYTRKFDFPRRIGLPKIEVMIASIPRSGSTAFCFELWRTGLLGAPLEYANLGLVRRQLRWRKLMRHELSYWSLLQRVRTSPNGAFSYKFFIQDYTGLQREAPRLVSKIAPTHVVYFTRQDKLAQAISYSRAIRSQAWFAGGPRTTDLPYDAAHIDRVLSSIAKQEDRWERVFDMTGTSPLRASYEDLLENPRAVVDRVLNHVLGSPARGVELQIPKLEIQRNASSEDWRERYSGEETHNTFAG